MSDPHRNNRNSQLQSQSTRSGRTATAIPSIHQLSVHEEQHVHNNIHNRNTNSNSNSNINSNSNSNQNSNLSQVESPKRNSLPRGINRHSPSIQVLTDNLHHANQYQNQYNSNPNNPPPVEESGIFGWIHSQQRKRQQQALEKAVEEQRRILLQETRRKKLLQKMEYSQEEEEEEEEWEGHQHHPAEDRPLSDNPTFQSLTNQNNTSMAGAVLSGLPLCGSNYDDVDDDEEYVVHSSGLDASDSFCTGSDIVSREEVAVQCAEEETELYANALEYHSTGTGASDGMYSCTAGSSEEDAFWIKTPCQTDAGGLTVQLEFMEKAQKASASASAISRKRRDPKDYIKFFAERESSIPFLLTLDQMTDIAENGLPPSVLFAKWKRIYSLQRDGDSFDGSFLKKVKGHERTLLVIQTTTHELMGAYSNSEWKGHGPSGSAHFYGSAQASLFKVEKETGEVMVYKWTGKNRYIQVCDMQHKMIAMGGGGKDGEFGLCVEDDFRVGSTGPCETFDNARLCSQDQFEIVNVECWGFISGFC